MIGELVDSYNSTEETNVDRSRHVWSGGVKFELSLVSSVRLGITRREEDEKSKPKRKKHQEFFFFFFFFFFCVPASQFFFHAVIAVSTVSRLVSLR